MHQSTASFPYFVISIFYSVGHISAVPSTANAVQQSGREWGSQLPCIWIVKRTTWQHQLSKWAFKEQSLLHMLLAWADYTEAEARLFLTVSQTLPFLGSITFAKWSIAFFFYTSLSFHNSMRILALISRWFIWCLGACLETLKLNCCHCTIGSRIKTFKPNIELHWNTYTSKSTQSQYFVLGIFLVSQEMVFFFNLLVGRG